MKPYSQKKKPPTELLILALIKKEGAITPYQIHKRLKISWATVMVNLFSLLAQKKIEVEVERHFKFGEKVKYIVKPAKKR